MGQNKKAKSYPICFVQLHDLFFTFFQNYTFLALLRDMMVSYIYVTLPSLCDAYRKESGQRPRKRKEQRRVGEMMRNTPCYIPLRFSASCITCVITSLLSVCNYSSHSFPLTVPESVARNDGRLSLLGPTLR
jgi:hypothetical protein